MLSAAKPGAGVRVEPAPGFAALNTGLRNAGLRMAAVARRLVPCVFAAFVGASEPVLTVIVGGQTATHTAGEPARPQPTRRR